MKIKYYLIAIAVAVSSIASFAKSESKYLDSYAFTRGVEAYNEGKKQDAYDWFEGELSKNPKNGYAYLYISV